MTSTRKGYFIGDDGNKKFFTLVNNKPICDDLLEGAIYHDRLWNTLNKQEITNSRKGK